jgi:hypothetical protein
MKLLIERTDGGVSIMTIVNPGETEEQIAAAIDAEIAKWQSSGALRARRYWRAAPDSLPTDRTFRDAWVHDGASGCKVDMEKARAIHMGRIRATRDERLKALDVETVKAVGRGDQAAAAAVEGRKQTLRDLPRTIDLTAAMTPEELKAIWPAELTGDPA